MKADGPHGRWFGRAIRVLLIVASAVRLILGWPAFEFAHPLDVDPKDIDGIPLACDGAQREP